MQYDAIISLGWDCQVARQLSTYKIRSASMPFDWIITSFDTMYRLLETQFDGFLQPQNLRLVQAADGTYKVLDELSGALFVHEFPLDNHFLSTYEQAKSKLDRRVERLLKVLHSDAKIVLIRADITKDQAAALNALLTSQFPRLRYLLVALGHSEDMKTDWNMANTRNFHIRRPQPGPRAWEGDTESYKAVFECLDLLEEGNIEEEAPFPPEMFQATIACATCPTIMHPGEPSNIVVTVRNDSQVVWPTDPTVHISYHWLRLSREVERFEHDRPPLPRALRPGETVRVDLLVEPPAGSGAYVLQPDLIIEHVAWFSEHKLRTEEITVLVE